jgi:hypothetical protein
VSGCRDEFVHGHAAKALHHSPLIKNRDFEIGRAEIDAEQE